MKLTPKEQRDPNYCSKHPTYRALRSPTTGCQRCTDKYRRLSGAVTTKRIVNRIAIVLDESGSMSMFSRTLVDELNKTLADLSAKATQMDQKNVVSLYSFNHATRRWPNDAFCHGKILQSQYRAGGSTALNDAIINAINDLNSEASPDDAFLVVIMTDGEENASTRPRHVTRAQIAQMNATDRWTFAFQVPNGHAQAVSRDYGIPIGNILEWDTTTVDGFKTAVFATNQSYGTYFGVRSTGKLNTKEFYTTDLSKLKQATVKKTLDNIVSEVNIWNVDKETELRSFVEKKHSRQFLKGAAFYQLTKTEKKVQDHKKLLIVPKGKDEVYAGDEARDLLGLPLTGTVKVVPGNHAGYDVFVQSTSTNRKLVRGTKVVYWPAAGVPYKEGPSARRKR